MNNNLYEDHNNMFLAAFNSFKLLCKDMVQLKHIQEKQMPTENELLEVGEWLSVCFPLLFELISITANTVT